MGENLPDESEPAGVADDVARRIGNMAISQESEPAAVSGYVVHKPAVFNESET